MKKQLNVTIVGGGFGGVKAALELSDNPGNQVTLISDRDDFQYYPALFSTATGHSHRESWVPLSAIFDGRTNVSIERDAIESIDVNAKLLKGERSHHYEDVILALGSVTTYFGIKGLDTYAYGIKSQEEIRRLQQHLWEEMSDGTDDEKNYVIIGAGPTGVELAGALGEYLRTLRKHFGIRKKRLRISLIEAAPRVLPRMSESTSRAVEKRLESLGVNVETGMKVERQAADSLVVNKRLLMTQTVIWTSGVANAPFYEANSDVFRLNERGKVVVDEFMRSSENVYVIGDNAATPYAGLAQTALHDAIYVAKHLAGHTKRYKVVAPSFVVPVGNRWAVFEWGRLRFSGIPAAIMRSAADLIGYNDVLPIGWALKAWRAQSVKELRIPDSPETSNS